MLERRLIKLRDNIFYDEWEKNKGDYSAEDLSKVFSVELKNFYRIINEKENRKTQQKN